MSQETLDREANDITPESGPVLIREITPSNFLSFGPDTAPIELRSLNVLIGANGSGKSNLLEAIAFLRAAPTVFQKVMSAGGGVTEWIWKGNPAADASIDAVLTYPDTAQPLRHAIGFAANNHAFRLSYEVITNATYTEAQSTFSAYYRYQDGSPLLWRKGFDTVWESPDIDLNRSILAQRTDPDFYPALAYLEEVYSKIRIYRVWGTDVDSTLRAFQPETAQTKTLEEDFFNLKPFLRRLWQNPESKEKIRESLRDFMSDFEDLVFDSLDDFMQLYFIERGNRISARRLSDGTLRWLCLLAILCDPNPPPLICLEEPEVGLHTDMLPKIADLLTEASERTQLIVTTHSDILVDALTETPEAILVCEKKNGQTQIERLDQAEIGIWLDKYRLGELWLSGELGGKRW